MVMEARAIGLRGSGKSTLIAALAEGRGDGHVATVQVGDPRVRALAEIFRPRKTTFAEFKVQEVPWPAATARKNEMERYLDAVAGGQLYLHVVRAFVNPATGEPPHPQKDLEDLDREFLLYDLIRVERALERAKKAPLPDSAKRALLRCQEALEGEIPLRELVFEGAELSYIRGYQFLTMVPQLIVVNTESGEQWDPRSLESLARGRQILTFPFLEAVEVSRLSLEEQHEFAAEFGLPGPASEVVARAVFDTMGLICFFTVGGDEVRAWAIRKGETAREAAGAVHSDMQRGFIRAEVVAFADFMNHGASIKSCREAGVVRVEGKDYVVADGDIITFRFNV